MKKLLILLMLTGCASPVVPNYTMSKYGEECFHKPYTDKMGDSYLCQANAIAKHNKQVELYNGK